MRMSTLILACAGLVLAGSALALAQAPAPPAGGAGVPPPMAYDASREQTLQGTVVGLSVDARGPGRMVVLAFSTDSASWKVLAGPRDLLRRQGLTLVAGDRLTLVGVPVPLPDGRGFLARTVTLGATTAILLDADGRPTDGRPRGGAPEAPRP